MVCQLETAMLQIQKASQGRRLVPFALFANGALELKGRGGSYSIRDFLCFHSH